MSKSKFMLASLLLITHLPAQSQSILEKSLKELQTSEGLPLELTINIFNAAEKNLKESKAIHMACHIGREMNKKGIPMFNFYSIKTYHDKLSNQDYSAYGDLSYAMRILIPGIKLSALIKTVTSSCPEVF